MASGKRKSWESKASHRASWEESSDSDCSTQLPALSSQDHADPSCASSHHGDEQHPDDSSDDDGPCPEVAAGQQFVHHLEELNNKGKLSAKDVCILCYYASKAGAQ
eukprot:8675222-Karenia_brevis.AAC.1